MRTAKTKRDSATDERELLEGRPVWRGTPSTHVKHAALKRSIKADVAIVGAGVSGAFMAEALSRHFSNVVVVDRRLPVHGSTSASTALLQFEIDTPLIHLSRKIGAVKARRAWQRSYRAAGDIQTLVHRLHIRCGLQARDALYLAGDVLGSRAMEKELDARHRADMPGEYLNAAELYARFCIDRSAAILSPGNAVVNPVQLAAGLLRRAQTRGARVFAPVEVKSVLPRENGVVLDCGAHLIEARHAVFCTGYEILKDLPRKGTKISSTWAIASKKHSRLPAWLRHTVVWEAADPYLYLRTTPDGRLIVGGEDEDESGPMHRKGAMARKARALVRKTARLLPEVDLHVTHRWAGAFGESRDGLPRIGAVPGMPHCFAVLGFGGNGTTYSLIGAQIVAGALTCKPDSDADLFRFR